MYDLGFIWALFGVRFGFKLIFILVSMMLLFGFEFGFYVGCLSVFVRVFLLGVFVSFV